MTVKQYFTKLLLWMLIVLPIISTIYFWFFASLMIKLANEPNNFPMSNVIPLHISSIALVWVLFLAYIIHLSKTTRVSSSSKPWWVLGFLFFSPFSMIYYWVKYINPLKFKS